MTREARLVLLVVLAALATGVATAGDPAQVVGPEACAECHNAEVTAWKATHHAASSELLKDGREIAVKLGIDRTYRREGVCLGCHATVNLEGERPRVAAGVSCESCHGPARDWIRVHNDYGGPGVTREQESAEHRAERWKKSEAGGMLRPGSLRAVAANCFGCHTTPNEELVNKGGHPTGSDFELVAWSQGEVRHNYLASQGKQNAVPPKERLRVMYVTGRALDLEFALRGLAKASGDGAYAQAMQARAERAFAALKEIQAKVEIPPFKDLLTAGLSTDRAAASAAADKVGAAAKKFAESNDGGGLAALDGLLPSQAKGQASP